MPVQISCFKAYDVRGRIPDELNEDIAYRIANATADYLDATRIVLGRDIRETSATISDAVVRGLTDAGVEVLDIGLGGTEMVYFATGELHACGGIMVTASHNPADYNGLKLVRSESRPISADTGLAEIRTIAEGDSRRVAAVSGKVSSVDISAAYVEHLLSYIDADKLSGLRIVANAGNGGAGLILDLLEPNLPIEFIKVHHEPDGRFPNGVPNPMLVENRESTIAAIAESGADFGIAWDGDFDRCFFFDSNGRFIDGYYIVGLLAEMSLVDSPGAAIVYDPRVTWNTIALVTELGGRPVQSKSGHAFVKDVMREHDAVYGGEMSSHHYFRNFFYCDSGMIPWLLVALRVAESGRTLGSLVDARMDAFPASGEINLTVTDASAAIDSVRETYVPSAKAIDTTDGISVEFENWRFNLRSSNTEPVIRLNVESRGDKELMNDKTAEILDLLKKFS